MRSEWDHLADWWTVEVATDPAYVEQVVPLVLRMLRPEQGRRYLDLGCGEGQAARSVIAARAHVVGCDIAAGLLARRAPAFPAVLCRLPDLAWARPRAFDGAYAVLVLEHLDDVDALFAATHRVVRPDGILAVVVNHPVFTAPGAGPFIDPGDGEPMWRWGGYFSRGMTEEPAGAGTVTFHHRSTGDLLTSAARAGWDLEEMVEEPVGDAAAERDPLLAAQRHIPRLLAVRWRSAAR